MAKRGAMMDEPFDFEAEDRFEIQNRGYVFAGPCPFDLRDLHHGAELMGRIVRLRATVDSDVDPKWPNGAVGHEGIYQVRGVETRKKFFPPKRGEPIGLLVGPRLYEVAQLLGNWSA